MTRHDMTNTHLLVHRFEYVRPASLADAVRILQELGEDTRILAGGTNLLVDAKFERFETSTVLDIGRLAELHGIDERADGVRIGASTSIRTLAVSELLWRRYTALAEAAASFGSTAVAMRATLGGNVCNGSPASDTVPALLALGAEAVLVGADGERTAAVGDLLVSPGRTRLREGEILAAIRLPLAATASGSAFVKIGRIRADLAKVSAAVRVSRMESRCAAARIELGSVGPTVVRARRAEAVLHGEPITPAQALRAGEVAAGEIAPIDDVRSTADYRRRGAVALVHDAVLTAWGRSQTGDYLIPRGMPGPVPVGDPSPVRVAHDERARVGMTVNGEWIELAVAPNDLLLNVLRERLNLTGTKYGCGIGECGACTVWLDGAPALACLVLAIAADGRDVRTIEGLAGPGGLDPLQEAFIEENAFQCGYCTPGMLMMTKRLVEEIPDPTDAEVRDYLKGNHCRCTGYASIVRAVHAYVARAGVHSRSEREKE